MFIFVSLNLKKCPLVMTPAGIWETEAIFMSLYTRSEICVHIHVTSWCWPPPILFVIFMDRIPRWSHGQESVSLRDLRITSLCRWSDSIGVNRHHAAWNWEVCVWIWSSWDESHYLQVWRHGSLPEKDGLLPSGWEWVAAPCGTLCLRLHLVICQMLLPKVTYKWGTKQNS